MYIEQIKELQKTHRDIVFDLYETVADISALIASLKAGCTCKIDHIRDMVADAEHMREVVVTLNAASIDTTGRPLCPDIERATNGQIIAAVIRHSQGRPNKPPDLSWLDEIKWP